MHSQVQEEITSVLSFTENIKLRNCCYSFLIVTFFETKLIQTKETIESEISKSNVW